MNTQRLIPLMLLVAALALSACGGGATPEPTAAPPTRAPEPARTTEPTAAPPTEAPEPARTTEPTAAPPTEAPEPARTIEPTAAPPTEAPEPTRTPEPTGAGEATVNVVDSSFTKGTITVPVGTTVIWTNNGQFPHTVTADDNSFDSGTLRSGDTFSYTFDQAGTYAYYCEFHGGPGGVGMSGTIIATGE